MFTKLTSWITPFILVAFIILGLFTWAQTNKIDKLEQTIQTNAEVISKLENSVELERNLKELSETHQKTLEEAFNVVSNKVVTVKEKVSNLTVEETDEGLEIDLAWEAYEGLK